MKKVAMINITDKENCTTTRIFLKVGREGLDDSVPLIAFNGWKDDIITAG